MPTPSRRVPAASFTGTPAEVTVTELSSGPVGVAAVDGAPWVVLPDDGAVRTADDAMIDVGGTPLRLLADGRRGVGQRHRPGRLVRIDAGTGRVTRRTTLAPAGSEPEGLAFDGDTLWVVDQAGNRVVPVDPTTGRPARPVEVGVGPRLAAHRAGRRLGRELRRRLRLPGRARRRGHRPAAGDLPLAAGRGRGGRRRLGDLHGGGPGPRPRRRRRSRWSRRSTASTARTRSRPTATGCTPWGRPGRPSGRSTRREREVVGRLALDDAGPTTENVGAAVTDDGLAVTHPEVRRLYEVPPALLGD